MTYFIGVDPDLHATGIAVMHEEEVVHVTVARIPAAFRGLGASLRMIHEVGIAAKALLSHGYLGNGIVSVAMIEGQTINFRQTANPASILPLSYVAGGAAASLLHHGLREVHLVEPRTWKGQVPKPIHQSRILKQLGWEHSRTKTHAVPDDPPVGRGLKSAEWKHVIDAIGLAMYARQVSLCE